MGNAKKISLVFWFVALVMTSCQDSGHVTQRRSSVSELSSTNDSSDTEFSGNPPALVTVRPDAQLSAWPLSMRQGHAVIAQGCVRLKPADKRISQSTLVFPTGYRLERRRDGWSILTTRGVVWATIVQDAPVIRVGGADISEEEEPTGSKGLVDRFVAKHDQSQCPPPYWLVKPAHAEEMRAP